MRLLLVGITALAMFSNLNGCIQTQRIVDLEKRVEALERK